MTANSELLEKCVEEIQNELLKKHYAENDKIVNQQIMTSSYYLQCEVDAGVIVQPVELSLFFSYRRGNVRAVVPKSEIDLDYEPHKSLLRAVDFYNEMIEFTEKLIEGK